VSVKPQNIQMLFQNIVVTDSPQFNLTLKLQDIMLDPKPDLSIACTSSYFALPSASQSNKMWAE